MTNIRHSLAWSYSTKYALLLVQFVSTVVMARLVTPDDIGIFSVAAVFIGLGQLFREFGVNRYIVQEVELTTERIRSASTLNLLTGWSMGLVIFLSAPAIGAFYDRAEVVASLHLLSLNFVFVPLGAISFAYLRRSMLFDRMMAVQFVSAALGAGVGIVTAFHGEGYRALIWSSIANSASAALLAHVLMPHRLPWLPGLSEIGHVFKYCRYAGPESIVREVGDTAPNWILGKALGMEQVGLYSRALGTLELFGTLVMHGLNPVLMPYFSKAIREGTDVSKPYVHIIACLSSLAWPFYLMLMLLAAPVVEVLFGSQWREAAPLVQIMCAGAFMFALIAPAQEVLTGVRQIKAVLTINLVMAVVRILLVLVSAPHGLLAVAAAVQFAPLIRLLLVSRYVRRHLGVRLRDMKGVLAKNIMLSILTASPAIGGIALFGWTLQYSVVYLVAISILSGCLWLAMVYLLKPPILEEIAPFVAKGLRLLRKPSVS